MKELKTSPELKNRPFLPLVIGSLAVGTVMFALPLTQYMGEAPIDPQLIATAPAHEKPPPVIEPEKLEEEEKPEETIEDLEEDRQLPTLTEIEIQMDPDLSGVGGTGTGAILPGIPDLSKDVYLISELTRRPDPISQTQPLYPPEAKRIGMSGTVKLEFIVEAQGNTRNIKVLNSSNPLFERNAINAVRKWRFKPGEVKGKAVDTKVHIVIPFKVN